MTPRASWVQDIIFLLCCLNIAVSFTFFPRYPANSLLTRWNLNVAARVVRERATNASPLTKLSPSSKKILAGNKKEQSPRQTFRKEKFEYEFNRRILLRYKELYGDMRVPKSFIVPANNASWPVEMWGDRLGGIVQRIRHGVIFKDKREDLIDIGFDFNNQRNVDNVYEWRRRMLLQYKELYGDMRVPKVFIVPANNASWPVEMWGERLGNIVQLIRRGFAYRDKHEDLKNIGFDFDNQQEYYGWEQVKTALLTYKRLYRDLLVRHKFQVPDDDNRWPESTWGMKLGSIVQNIRSCNNYASRREELLEMGFDYNPQNKRYKWDSIEAALLTYKVLYGDLNIPRKFEVPSKDPFWREDTWGMPLGQSLSRIRNKGTFKSYRKEQEEMGILF